MARSTHTQYYSNFVGLDASSDPRAVSRNRLAYLVNMWRDYESEQGAAVETFPGFRRVAHSLGFDAEGDEIGAVHGLYHFRSRKGQDYVVVHAGTKIYAFEDGALASGNYEEIANRSAIISEGVADRDSTGFIYNNNLYILDGDHYLTVTTVDGETSEIRASAVDAYVPTTYYNGNLYEQRNMLTNLAKQIDTSGGELFSEENRDYTFYFHGADNGATTKFYKSFGFRKFVVNEPADSIIKVSYGDEECRLDSETEAKYDEDQKKFIVGSFYFNNNDGTSILDSTKIRANMSYRTVTLNDEEVKLVDSIYVFSFAGSVKDVKELHVELELHPSHFNTVENIKHFVDGNTDYKGTTIDAINGCTKSAVFDGRVFLTGNRELPNTVFYSHRNLTGANDPAYFGIYNYFNDGEGNTPNVDILSTPSMLMVLKGNTVQDGSVYYHQGVSNEDEATKDIIPRIYPSTQGAAGLGSAGDTVPSRLSCNFYDDPVFLSRRGLEAVGKETVNLERTIQHRSSNIDRLLIREDLARASLAEWKRYLVICCNGHMYLADSRYMTQHSDGSYQYEWYYLEGVGTYENYTPVWRYLDYMPIIEPEGLEAVMLDEMKLVGGGTVGEEVRWRDGDKKLARDSEIYEATIYHPDDDGYKISLYYTVEDGVKYVVEANGAEMKGVGEFFGATKILTVGERLIFGTDNGDICIINTDMRGVSVGDRFIEHDRIDRSFYSFNGVAYLSGCSLKLDDCDAKSCSKNTVPGTTTVRFKMMPGSHCTAMVSTNGRDWQRLGEAFSSRLDFADIEFSNLSFSENENNVVVFPEISRSWVNKQYYFYSDRFEAPFGLYELSYLWYVSGKIRY